MTRFLPLIIITLISYTSFGQTEWITGMFDPDANFYQTQEKFNDYWSEKQIEKGKMRNANVIFISLEIT